MVDFGGAGFFLENMTVSGTTTASAVIARRVQSRYRRWEIILKFPLACWPLIFIGRRAVGICEQKSRVLRLNLYRIEVPR